MTARNDHLIVTVTASYKGAVGFGEIFECQILKVLDGSLDEKRINLSVLPRDKEILNFIYDHLQPDEIEIGFKIHRTNEPYSLSPISGFVDESKTSWVIEFISEAKERAK